MKFKYLTILAAFAAFSLAFTACSDDDDDDEGGSGSASSVPATAGKLESGTSADNNLPDGYRITRVGYNFSYTYNDRGVLSGIIMNDYHYDCSKGKLSFTVDDDEETGSITVSLNKDNLINKVYGSSKWKDSGGPGSSSGTITCSYNSNNQLVSMKETGKESGTDSDGKYNYTYEATTTLTYSGTRLEKSVCKWTENTNGEHDSGQEEYTYYYNSTRKNTFYQYTPILCKVFDEGILEPFAYLGLVGKASSQLPTSYVHNGYTYGCDNYSYNSYGALSSANYNDYRYEFDYYYNAMQYAPAIGGAKKVSAAHFKHARRHGRK